MSSLLELSEDRVAFQKEWTIHGQLGLRSFNLEIALFAGNIGPGLFIISSFTGFGLGLLAGFLIVLVGYGIPHLVFLGRMERFWRAIFRPGKSWISRGFIFASLFLLFSFLSSVHLLPVPGFGQLHANAGLYQVLLVCGFISAFLLVLYPGFLFSVLRAIPFWNSPLLVPLFVLQSICSGISLTFLLTAFTPSSGIDIRVLAAGMSIILGVNLLLILLHVWSKKRSGSAGMASFERLVHGKYRFLFSIGVLVSGIILPLIILGFMHIISFIQQGLIAASVLQLLGVLAFKYSLLNVGAYSELYPG